MPETPEARLRRQVMDWLKRQAEPIYTVKQHGSIYAQAGVPDLLLCVSGRFVGCELKAGRNKATAIQEVNLKAIRDAGGVAGVCRSVDDVAALVALARGE